MSLFRKPTKRIQRRVFEAADDDEEGDPEPPPPPVISREQREAKPVKSTPLLSFADEEEESEVFKVKKSTQSKRFARRREKEKKKTTNVDSKLDELSTEDNAMDVDEHVSLNNVPKKKVTLEGLILSGREALAADGTGDISDDNNDQEENDEEQRGFHQFRAESVRAALAAAAAPGHIPDAALIHAARKTRQQARELGEYVPIRDDDSGTRAAGGSRLIQEDGSGDDEEEGRLHVRGLELPSDKPKRGTTTTVPSDEEVDSESEQWEEQQLQKAMPALNDIMGSESGMDLNPFAVAPPPPRLDEAPAHLRPLAEPGAPPPATPADLVQALQERLRQLYQAREVTSTRHEELRERLLQRARVHERCAARSGPLDAAYRRAQAVRGYLTDLIECLDEKLPQLETLEARALSMHRRRCEFVQERRRADVRDQAHDVLTAGRTGGARPPDYEAKVRRAAEREGRRRARRLKREAAAAGALNHRDGDSSDDELPPAERQHAEHEREAIGRLSSELFADALPAWRSVRGVCARLALWRRRDPRLYADAYVAECLPKLLAPYVRHQLILWNPLADEDNEDYEKMDWYKCMMMYGVREERLSSDSEGSEPNGDADHEYEVDGQLTEERVRNDQDLMLVPMLVHRAVIPKLTELVEHAWDPMCVRACVRLRGLLLRACALPPRASPALRRLATVSRARLVAAVAADVYLPAVPPQVWEGSAGGGAFWRRCLGAGVRLLRAALALCAPPSELHAHNVALNIIGTLCTAAAVAPAAAAAGAAAALASALPRDTPLRAVALRRLAALAQHALNNLHSDNPLHLLVSADGPFNYPLDLIYKRIQIHI